MAEFNPEEMDRAAREAEDDLQNLTGEAVKSVSEWFAKWYLRAGHKRLGRVLVALAKQGE